MGKEGRLKVWFVYRPHLNLCNYAKDHRMRIILTNHFLAELLNVLSDAMLLKFIF